MKLTLKELRQVIRLLMIKLNEASTQYSVGDYITFTLGLELEYSAILFLEKIGLTPDRKLVLNVYAHDGTVGIITKIYKNNRVSYDIKFKDGFTLSGVLDIFTYKVEPEEDLQELFFVYNN